MIFLIYLFLQDRHVKRSGDVEPAVDSQQDYVLMLGYENATHTVMRFKRKLETCDTYDMPISVSLSTVFCPFLFHLASQSFDVLPLYVVVRGKSEEKPLFFCRQMYFFSSSSFAVFCRRFHRYIFAYENSMLHTPNKT